MFDRDEFSKLLTLAIGSRTSQEFAVDSKVNRTYISKYLNKRFIDPPHPSILRKIARSAFNGVSLGSLMKVCGYEFHEGAITFDGDKAKEVLTKEEYEILQMLLRKVTQDDDKKTDILE